MIGIVVIAVSSTSVSSRRRHCQFCKRCGTCAWREGCVWERTRGYRQQTLAVCRTRRVLRSVKAIRLALLVGRLCSLASVRPCSRSCVENPADLDIILRRNRGTLRRARHPASECSTRHQRDISFELSSRWVKTSHLDSSFGLLVSAEILVREPTHTEVFPEHRHNSSCLFPRSERALSASGWSSPFASH